MRLYGNPIPVVPPMVTKVAAQHDQLGQTACEEKSIRPNEPIPLSSTEIRRLLRDDRGLDPGVRQAIAKSLALDALAGLVPHRLQLAVQAHRWPITIVTDEAEVTE